MPYFLPCVRAVVSFCRSAGGLIPAASWMYQQLIRLVSRLMNMTDDAGTDSNTTGVNDAVAPDSPTSSVAGGGCAPFSVPPAVGVDTRTLARLKKEYSEIEATNGWDEVFAKISEDAYNPLLTFKESRKPRNRALNRYKNVSPYDHSRVVLSDCSVDYVNANLVEAPSVGRRYILSQGPLEGTASHTWLMIWQQKTKGIIMLNALFEKKIPKCFQYWPEKVGESLKFGDVQLQVTLDDESTKNFYTTRKFSLTKMSGSNGASSLLSPGRIITQFHYTTWPDFGAPKSPDEFLEFLLGVRESGVLEPEVGPAVVHCSAGIGRSGTFCLVDACLIALAAGRSDVSVRDTLLAMRNYRMGLVQTPDQYRFAFQAILQGAEDLRLVPRPVSSLSRVNSAGFDAATGFDGEAEILKANGDVRAGAVLVEHEDVDEPSATAAAILESHAIVHEDDASDGHVETIGGDCGITEDGVVDGKELLQTSRVDDDAADKFDLKRPANERHRDAESPAKHPKTIVNPSEFSA